MAKEGKPACRFGSQCYRKNPSHFAAYYHPVESKSSKLEEIRNVRGSRKDKFSCRTRTANTETGQTMKVQKKMKQGVLQFPPKSFSVNLKEKVAGEDSKHNIIARNPDDTKEKSVETVDDSLKNKPDEEFFKSVGGDVAFKCCDLKLVGPFDVLSGKINHPMKLEDSLIHWRFYYDPPEFQTVLATQSEYHIGYWRDDPEDFPVFLASNTADKDCTFRVLSNNIFGTVFQYLVDFEKASDPFKKVKIKNLQTALCDWATKNKFSIKDKSKLLSREKKVVSKTFHKAGIVVPVEKKTGIGYRPLIETEAKLRKICSVIMSADEDEKESLMGNLQPLITAANIANDECDFGNCLELGIDLFCMGSPVFHNMVEYLLGTAYSLLNRNAFKEIITAHLKNRKKGKNLSIF